MFSSNNDEDDGWTTKRPDEELLDAFDAVEVEMMMQPDKTLPVKPKPIIHSQNTRVEHLLHHESDYEDDDHCKRFFTPPLQVQRNTFVCEKLLDYTMTVGPIIKLGVMGCGEMSLEKSLCTYLPRLSTKLVLSVDIDEPSLAIGVDRMAYCLERNDAHIKAQNGLPVLYKVFSGDILNLDYRFANAACICSLEVIEHMSLIDASKFVDNVLGALQPEMFILSTPNHDYNEAFNEKPGVFRHSDHKFEFTAKQFAEWISTMVRPHPNYFADGPKYVGVLKGFEHLHGATQFVIFRKTMSMENNDICIQSYFMASSANLDQDLCKDLQRRVVQKAFLDWLKHTELHREELKQGTLGPHWEVDIRKILHHLEAPMTFVLKIDGIHAVKLIHEMCHLEPSDDSRKHPNSVIIPESADKSKLLALAAN